MAPLLERPQAALPSRLSGIHSREGGNRRRAPPRTRLSGVTRAFRTSVTPRLNEDDIVDVIAVTAVQAAAAGEHT